MGGFATDVVETRMIVSLPGHQVMILLTSGGEDPEPTAEAFYDQVRVPVAIQSSLLIDGIRLMPSDESCDVMVGGGDYCNTCGWNTEQHGDPPHCADWCGLDLDHDGPCREH